ncbi:MAG: Hpt domain-containing protein, partial [Acidobacteria bacterium]|nr:Hpt domain-containing protein [Acidobacteriota bacterium]
LKGMAGNFGAHQVVALAYELETLGRNGQTAGAASLSATLAKEIARLNAALQTFVAGELNTQAATAALNGAAPAVTV